MTDSTPTNSTSPNQLRDPDIFWLHRWLALKETIQTTRDNKDTKEPFKGLLDNLFEFGQKQFLYFFLGFTHNGVDGKNKHLFDEAVTAYEQQKPTLLKDYDYLPEYVLRSTLDKIAVDFGIIQRAIHQWLHGTENQKETLLMANLWGQELLNRVFEDSNIKFGTPISNSSPTVISYFNRSPQIRMIPYDDVALIGIPLTTTQPNQKRDLLAIGHELGHYVYWHGYIGQQSVRELLKHIVRDEMPYIKNWIEEIFADVFGFVVSKQMAMSMVALDMVADNPSHTHVQDNHVHPIDALRPYIYINTISTLGLDFRITEKRGGAEAVNRLKGGRQRFQTTDRKDRKITIELKDAVSNLQSIIVNLLADTFLGQFTNTNWDILETETEESQLISLSKWWENNRGTSWEKEKENRYAAFEATLKDIYESSQNVELKQLRQQKDKEHNGLRSFEVIRETIFPEAVQPEVWKRVFESDGWAIKGPETQPVGGLEGESSGGHNPFH